MKEHYLTVGQLKEFFAKHPDIEDDAHVFAQRIKDVYFEKNGWASKSMKGYHYYQIERINDKIRKDLVEKKEEFTEAELNEFKDEYIEVFCAVYYSEDKQLFLNCHY